MKKALRVLGAVGIVLLLVHTVVLPVGLKAYGFNSIEPIFEMPRAELISEREIIFDEPFTGDIHTNWRTYQNLHGEVIEIPETNLEVSEGHMRLEIQPDPNYEKYEKKYNNAFTLSKTSFQPTDETKIGIDWTMSVDPGDLGARSTGLWIHKSDIFGENGAMRTNGFTWAFGLNFLSDESKTSGLSGMTFTYVEGWVTLCTIPITDVDPTAENHYRIEWTTTGWSGYVNDTYYGTCPIATNDPAVIQTWADNSWVPHILFALMRQNPLAPVGTTYGPIQVWRQTVAP